MNFKKVLSLLVSAVMIASVAAVAGCENGNGNGGGNSDPTPLDKPVIELSGNVISWDAVDHADGYIVTENSVTVSTQTELSYTINKTVTGTYTYTVTATSTDSKYSNSAASDPVDYKYTAQSDPVDLAETTVYMVGDSTMCNYAVNEGGRYLPRFGYGMELGLYLDSKATIVNLAASGRSSWSFPTESASNYAQLGNIKEGDYLILGMGHNDQKTDDNYYTNPNLSYTDDTQFNGRTASFQKVLYDNYIHPAQEKGATVILCTPIVRLNKSNDYSGTSGHITETKDKYAGGNYAQAIRNLGEALDLTVIDLTEITKNDCTTLGYDTASNYYSFKAGKWSDGEGSTIVRDAIDTTHTNLYGAKMNAYSLATELKKSDNPLGKYVKENIVEPTYAADYEAGINTTYVPVPYAPFNKETTTKSTLWTGISDPWYGTAFGELGGDASTANFKVQQNSATSFTVGGLKDNKGKISDSAEGFAAAFYQVEAEADFEITATVTVDTLNTNSQSGFGMMLRDDIYIDANDSTILSNYVSAGYFNSVAIYSRESKSAITKSSNSATVAVGSQFELSIKRTGSTITVKFDTHTENYNNINLAGVDANYDYICLYATRGTTVTFTNVTITL